MTEEPWQVEDRTLDVYLAEHEALRAEQRQRIQTRDNILYLNIVAIGAAFSLVGKTDLNISLLVVPWIGLLLGWVHIANDMKTSEIREYIRTVLFPNIQKLSGRAGVAAHKDQWDAHREEKRAWPLKRRTYSLIKVTTFFLPGAAALVAFFLRQLADEHRVHLLMRILAIFEAVMMVWLLLWLDRDYGFRKWGRHKRGD